MLSIKRQMSPKKHSGISTQKLIEMVLVDHLARTTASLKKTEQVRITNYSVIDKTF